MSYSISFPDIFNGSTVNLEKDYNAVKSNLILLLGSNKGGLYGDPWFGTEIKSVLWDQAHKNLITQLVRDNIFQSIMSYMPRVDINRDDIGIQIYDNYVNVTINLSAYSSRENDLLQIKLLNNDQED